jgi:hypothetical protein
VPSGTPSDQAVACADRLLTLLKELIEIWPDVPVRIRNALLKARYLSIAEIASKYNDRCHKFMGLGPDEKHMVEDIDARDYLPIITLDCRETGREWSRLRVTAQYLLMQAERVAGEIMLLLGTHGNTEAGGGEAALEAGLELETARNWITEVTAAINEMAEIHFTNCTNVMAFYHIRYLQAKGKTVYQKRTGAVDPRTQQPILNADGTKETVEASVPADLERLSREIGAGAADTKRLNKTGADSLPHIQQAVLDLKKHLGNDAIVTTTPETVVVVRTASTPPLEEEEEKRVVSVVNDHPTPPPATPAKVDDMEEGEVRPVARDRRRNLFARTRVSGGPGPGPAGSPPGAGPRCAPSPPPADRCRHRRRGPNLGGDGRADLPAAVPTAPSGAGPPPTAAAAGTSAVPSCADRWGPCAPGPPAVPWPPGHG